MKLHIVFLVISSLLLSAEVNAQVYGCTDSLAVNFNPAATVNDGSCVYDNASVSPQRSIELSSQISETSGLTFWNNLLWTHNDDTDTALYGLDTLNGKIIQTYLLNRVVNNDWEEISADDKYLYVGDFGNNWNGNRTDLKILRISKASMLAGNSAVDTISYHYSDQVDFSPTGANNTDFDCEAMIVSADSIHLFTKQWITKATTVYSLPKTPGNHTANHISSFNVEGLITGATYLKDQRLLILCGYNSLVSPFAWLIYDLPEHRFFSGNKRKISFSLPFHQTEGVYASKGLKVYTTNEASSLSPFINIPPQLHIFDLSPFLASYLSKQTLTIELSKGQKEIFIYPDPVTSFVLLQVADSFQNEEYRILNASGSIVNKGKMTGNTVNIDLSCLHTGIFLLKIGNSSQNTLKLIRR